MKIIVTGVTGMVGEGVLLTCLNDTRVTEVLMVNRKHFDLQHPKLKELILPDFTKPNGHDAWLTGYDGCFFCAGISSVGMGEEKYTHITYTTTLRFAEKVLQLNPQLVFTYVSGAGTDSTTKGRLMWARVKGRTENTLMAMPFKGEYNLRPGVMKAVKGQRNANKFYGVIATIMSAILPKQVLSLGQLGTAMINAVDKGYPKQVLQIKDIRDLAGK